MIQLVFDAADAGEALAKEPVEVGYSSHEGAERAAWGDEKLELVEGTHPVVYPAAGSHANKFADALYLGQLGRSGGRCDNTIGPAFDSRRPVKTIPSDPTVAGRRFPWLSFQGRSGELQAAFFNGPTGPNLKTQWARPIEWSQDWRDRGYAVPTGGVFGTGAMDLFCSGVAKGSQGTRPAAAATHRAAPAGTGALARPDRVRAVRATWIPAAPLRLGRRRRSWGQILSASARMYLSPVPPRSSASACMLIPLGFATALQWAVYAAIDLLGVRHGAGRRHLRVPRRGDRDDTDASRSGARSGGGRVRARRDRRRPADRPGARLSARGGADPAVAEGDRGLRRRVGGG